MANLGYIQMTRVCNQWCRFCSNPENGEILSLEKARALVDDLVSRGYDGAIFTGGEPTLNEELPEAIAYANERGLYTRMITNGQRLADKEYMKKLMDAGLYHVHFSIHSHKAAVHDYITGTRGSLSRFRRALDNAGELGLRVDINTVINRTNSDHLHETVEYLFTTWPYLKHQVWNNLDPQMNRSSDTRDTVPRLRDFEVALHKAMHWLHDHGKTFRVERVPLCYMVDFAECSTETRKLIKEEERIVHFLDDKGSVRQRNWDHGKFQAACQVCSYNPICSGLWEADTYYDSRELHPIFLDPSEVVRKVLGDEEYERRRALPAEERGLAAAQPKGQSLSRMARLVQIGSRRAPPAA